jgi:hypothetical protein
VGAGTGAGGCGVASGVGSSVWAVCSVGASSAGRTLVGPSVTMVTGTLSPSVIGLGVFHGQPIRNAAASAP